MNFLPANTPAYKTVVPVSQISTMQMQPSISSGLTGFFGSLFGNSTPTYKTVGGQSVQMPASSGIWSIFGVSSPSYKTAPAMADVPDDSEEALVDALAACAPGPDKIVVL